MWSHWAYPMRKPDDQPDERALRIRARALEFTKSETSYLCEIRYSIMKRDMTYEIL
jgi:hypothetical protein